MTIPQARQQVATHPAKDAVTAPVVKENKDADVARKLKLYGIFQAFRQGSLPTNKQIDKALLYAEKASPVDLKKLSPDGRKLVDDIRDIIETARLMILTKNDDELFQNFVYHTQVTDVSRGAQGKEALPTSKDAVKNDAENAAVHLRTLLTLVFTNSEMRKVISDMGLVGRDLFASVAAKTAEKARPNEEQLKQIDQEAPSDEWISKDGKRVGKDETPILQAKVGGHSVEHDPKAPAAEGTKHIDPHGNETNAGEAARMAKEKKHEYDSAKQDVKSQGASGLKQAAQEGKEAYREGGVEGVKQHGAERADQAQTEVDRNTSEGDKQNLKSKFAAFKDKLSPNDDKRNKVHEQRDRAQDFLDEEFPEERRQQFIYRLKKVVVECQKHNDYDDAINFFLDKADTYKGHSKHLANKGGDSVGAVAEDPAFQQAYTEFKTLLERFADGRSMDSIFDAVNALYTDADNDSELRHWFNQLSQYVRKCLVEPGYILEDESTREGRELRKTGKQFFDHKYAAHKDNLFNAIAEFFKAMGTDPVNVRFGEDWKRLTKDVLFDDNGSLEFKPQLWNDIREEILPSLIQQVGYIPIPRIEYTDKQVDLVIENLVLEGTNLLPNIVSLEAHNFIKFSPYKTIRDDSSHRFRIKLEQIQADMRDVGFAFKKKTGFPKLSDRGLADVLLSGNGVSVEIELASAGKRTDHAFLIKKVTADVDNMKFSIRESKHDFLYKVVTPLAQGLIKKAVAKAIEQGIKTGLEYVDEQLVGVKRAMDEAKESDETTRAETLKNIFNQKKQKAEHNKEKAEHKAAERESQFAVVTEKKDSVIPKVNPPHSTAQEAFSKERLAKEGENWKSPAFDIV